MAASIKAALDRDTRVPDAPRRTGEVGFRKSESVSPNGVFLRMKEQGSSKNRSMHF